MSKNYFIKGAACTYYTIKELSKHAPEVQVQPLMLTRFMYLVESELKTDWKYSMYHFGVYTPLITYFVEDLVNLKLVNKIYNSKKGTIITPIKKPNKNSLSVINEALSKEDRTRIRKLVHQYGKLKPLNYRLFIITTALFLKTVFNVTSTDKIIRTTQSLIVLDYPEQLDVIKKILLEANVIGKIQYNGGQHVKTEKGTEKAKTCWSTV